MMAVSEDDRCRSWHEECRGCDTHAEVDDLGLCHECAAKLDRDLIRERCWDYSVSAYGMTPVEREALRDHVIQGHGADPELITGSDRSRPRRLRKRRRGNRR